MINFDKIRKIIEIFTKTSFSEESKIKITEKLLTSFRSVVQYFKKDMELKAIYFCLIFMLLVIASFSFPELPYIVEEEPIVVVESILPTKTVEAPLPEPIEEEVIPVELPILDFSEYRASLQTSMLKINEPTLWGDTLLYSAGKTSRIDEPILTTLVLNNLQTNEEKTIAISDVRFGEIYEGRLSDDWIVWLDTNQTNINQINAYERSTGRILKINSASLNRPKIAIWNDLIIWSGQKDDASDEMHVFHLPTGQSVKVEDFANPTFGTSAPVVFDYLLVWASPHPEGLEEKSVIKTLDLRSLNFAQSTLPQDGLAVIDETTDGISQEIALKTTTIDPSGFAIYPSTNGSAIAWLDNLNPAQASLLLTLDGGETIRTVAEGVGRFFGVGEDFVTFSQQGTIKVYFWENSQTAVLTQEGESGKLSVSPVGGRTVVWYDFTDPNQRQDIVIRSEIPALAETQ